MRLVAEGAAALGGGHGAVEVQVAVTGLESRLVFVRLVSEALTVSLPAIALVYTKLAVPCVFVADCPLKPLLGPDVIRNETAALASGRPSASFTCAVREMGMPTSSIEPSGASTML